MRITLVATTAQLAAAWLTMFAVGTELFVISPLLPELAAAFGLSTAIAGSSVAVFSITYAVTAPLLGQISDRFGRRRVLVASLLAFAAANLGTATATDWPSLLGSRAFAGAAAAGISPSVYALVAGVAPANRRATWLGLTASGLLMSLALGAPAGVLTGAALGWPSVFTALAFASGLLAWLNLRVWVDERGFAEPSRLHTPPRLAALFLMRRLAPTVVWSTSHYGVYSYLGAGLTALGFSGGQIARAILFYGCGAIVGALVGGRMADRLGPKFTTGASFAGLCACFVLLRLALDTGVLLEPFLGVCSAVAQLFFPAQQAGLASEFPDRRGTALAWNNSALFVGISLGSLVGGAAASRGNFDATLTICAGIAVLGCLVNAGASPRPIARDGNRAEGPRRLFSRIFFRHRGDRRAMGLF